MKEISKERFIEIKRKAEELYKDIGDIWCPYFQASVSFNSAGLEHIKFKQHGKARTIRDQFVRLKLLNLAPTILKLSRTVQGIRGTQHLERVRVHNRTDTVLIPVSYFEFIAVIGEVRCKVIVKQIRDGSLFFWSIIPFWGIAGDTHVKKLYSGDPETD